MWDDVKREENIEKNSERNEHFLEEFHDYLQSQNLSPKTIHNHISNVSFYINEYLIYYDVNKMESGCYELDNFLGDWFIRKCMWSNARTIKETAASIKKFYKCMLENKHIQEEDYENLCCNIKDNMEVWLDEVDRYNNDDDSMWLL